jgi:hypothetical protein
VRRQRTLGLTALLAALMLGGAAPMEAATPVRFGAKLDNVAEPSNSSPPHDCGGAGSCMWVMAQAFHRQNGLKAPKNGTIRRIRLLAGDPGTLRVFLARVKVGEQKAKIVRKGPFLTYEGNGFDQPGGVEVFNVNIPVHKYDVLAVKAPTTSTLRCDSGGAKIFQYQPAPLVGGPFESPDDTDGCWLMIEAQYG